MGKGQVAVQREEIDKAFYLPMGTRVKRKILLAISLFSSPVLLRTGYLERAGGFVWNAVCCFGHRCRKLFQQALLKLFLLTVKLGNHYTSAEMFTHEVCFSKDPLLASQDDWHDDECMLVWWVQNLKTTSRYVSPMQKSTQEWRRIVICTTTRPLSAGEIKRS